MIDKIKVNAIKGDNGYKHFGIHQKSASLCGYKPEDIVELNMAISNNQIKPDPNDVNMVPDYWGWFDNEDKKFTLIYPKLFLLNMCFPYGIEIEENRNKGKAYRLEII